MIRSWSRLIREWSSKTSSRRRHGRHAATASERLETRSLLTALGGPAIHIDPSVDQVDSLIVQFRSEEARQPGPSKLGIVSSLSGDSRLISGLYEVELVAGTSLDEALAEYRSDPNVLFAEPNYRVQIDAIPNDSGFSQTWGFHNQGQTIAGQIGLPDADFDAPEAWDIFGGTGHTVVAVIDTGVDYNHPDLAANVWLNSDEIAGNGVDDDGNGFVDDVRGYDFFANDADPMDENGHGTHVAGTIAAVGNNGIGVAGVNPRARIMPLRFLGPNGSGNTSDAVRALNYAVANGAIVSNNSWGGGGYSLAMQQALEVARQAGHIFVASAGNSAWNTDNGVQYPAGYAVDNVLSVAATDNRDALASFSNYGLATVDLAAPGVSVLSTLRNNSYGYYSGTSMASPHVAGAIALLRDFHPDWSYDRIIDQAMNSVDFVSGLNGRMQTGGRLNLARALGPEITAPSVWALLPAHEVQTQFSSVRIHFSEAMDPASVTRDRMTLHGPNGPIDITEVLAIAGTENRQFDVRFAAQGVAGEYAFELAAGVRDTSGRRLDQDRDGVDGEEQEDAFSGSVFVAAPHVIRHNLVPQLIAPIDRVRVTFNESIDATTFSTEDVRWIGPSGEFEADSVQPVSGTNDTEFEITFPALSEVGHYRLVLGPQIADRSGNLMDQDGDRILAEEVDDQFGVEVVLNPVLGPDGFGYEALAVPGLELDLSPDDPSVFTVLDNADDSAAAIDLGANTFSFYGTTYSGAGRIFVGSNGLIAFTAFGASSYFNTNLSEASFTAGIAPLWDDWRTDRDSSDRILAKFDDSDSDGQADRLIIEWNDVPHYWSSNSTATFQAVLQLNSGSQPGAIWFNYPDLDVGFDGWNEGRSATVGIKGAGHLLQVTANAASDFVGTGKAILLQAVTPSALADEFTTLEDESLSVPAESGVLSNDSAARGGDLIAELVTGPQHGVVTLQPDGSFHYQPQPDFEGVDEFTYRIREDGLLSAPAVVTIVVQPVNDAPVLAPIASVTVIEGNEVRFTATATDPDANGNGLSFELIGSIPDGASIDPYSGEFVWIPSETQGGQSYPFTVRVTDDGSPALSSTQSFTVHVNEPNRAPVLQALANRTVAEGAILRFTVTATDPDPGSLLRFSLDPGAPLGASINPLTGQFYWRPTETQAPGTYPVTVRVTDNGSPRLSDTETFTISATEVNTAPVLAMIGNMTVTEGSLVTFTAMATDSDHPRNSVTYSLAPGYPAGASIHPTTGVFTWNPSETQGGANYRITVRATDDGTPARTGQTAFNVRVNEINSPPTFVGLGNQTVTLGNTLNLRLRATDPDSPAQRLRYALEPGAPAGMSLNQTTGLLTWRPGLAQVGNHTLGVRVTDNGAPALSEVRTISIQVTSAGSTSQLVRTAAVQARPAATSSLGNVAVVPTQEPQSRVLSAIAVQPAYPTQSVPTPPSSPSSPVLVSGAARTSIDDYWSTATDVRSGWLLPWQ